jgi:hypothetical protein
MKRASAFMVTVLSSLSQAICAQADEAVDRLMAYLLIGGMARLKCVDELLFRMAGTPWSRAAPGPELDHERDDLAGGL